MTMREALKIGSLLNKTVKTNDKIRRFGVVMTPLSRKNVLIMQIKAFKAMWREILHNRVRRL